MNVLATKNDISEEISLWSIKIYGGVVCLGEGCGEPGRIGMTGDHTWDILCKRRINKKKNITRYIRNICHIFTYQLMLIYRQIIKFLSLT